MLRELFQIIQDRYDKPVEGSYTCSLFERGEDRILQKVGEETVEVILAAKGQGDQRLIEESSDLLYHLWVLLVSKGISIDAIEGELRKRHR